jgi:hypothetical protein
MERDRCDAGRRGGEAPGGLLSELEAVVVAACDGRPEWPEKVGAGIVAGVEFSIEHPSVVDALMLAGWPQSASGSAYAGIIARLAGLISRDAPSGSRLPGSTDEALVAGIVGLVGDHVRIGRLEALRRLEPDLVLLALLPHLGFEEARDWANRFASSSI